MSAAIGAIVTSIGVRSTSVIVYFIGAVTLSVIDVIAMSLLAYAMSRLLTLHAKNRKPHVVLYDLMWSLFDLMWSLFDLM